MATSCAKICEVGGKGFFLPTAFEQQFEPKVRGIIYLALLIWCFMGISIVCDILMNAVQRITSSQIRRLNKATMQFVTVNVWNDSIANLSLLALGFRAPELLLTSLELVSGASGFMLSGTMGPLAVVGSAAFNMLVITAVCNQSIVDEAKTIKETAGFAVTSFASLIAYGWVFVATYVRSPDVIDVTEGAITVGLFPLLLIVAYFVEVGCPCIRTRRQTEAREAAVQQAGAKDLAAMEQHILMKFGSGLPDDQVLALMEQEYGEKVTRAHYRIQATRDLVGGKRLAVLDTAHLESARAAENASKVVADAAKEEAGRVTIEFASTKYSVMENVGVFEVSVCRGTDKVEGTVCVQYRTRNGSAQAPDDYIHTEGTLEFTEAEQQKTISIQIVDDEGEEDDEDFYVDLFNPKGDKKGIKAELGDKRTCTVRIIDNDRPGIFRFPREEEVVKEEYAQKVVPITVLRTNGSQGDVSCKFRTENGSAIDSLDFVATSGVLNFKDGQCEAGFDVVVKPRMRASKNYFRLVLEDPTGGATFADNTDGGADTCLCTLVIEPDEMTRDRVERVAQQLRLRLEKQQQANSNWKDQFLTALLVNGGDDEAEEPPPFSDYFMHIVTLIWKFLFALIPPVDYWGGWLCFLTSLGATGLLTAIMGDLASLAGCCFEIPDSITAITLIALGISYPDTFASRAAAKQDAHADASIGMVSGNNSVSVLLGLGVPWLAGALYWQLRGRTSEWEDWVSARDATLLETYPQGGLFVLARGKLLAFSALGVAGCSLITLLLFLIRRLIPAVGGELGGPKAAKIPFTVILVLLWLAYVGFSVWYAFTNPSACD